MKGSKDLDTSDEDAEQKEQKMTKKVCYIVLNTFVSLIKLPTYLLTSVCVCKGEFMQIWLIDLDLKKSYFVFQRKHSSPDKETDDEDTDDIWTFKGPKVRKKVEIFVSV